jgi:hypothetical protein
MKTFAEYLIESKHTFDYKIKIVGDIGDDFVAAFKEKLKQFDVIAIGGPKRVPVQATLMDFPGISNEGMSIFDVSFNYPATEPQITQIAQLLGLKPDRVRIVTKQNAESAEKELENQLANKNLLTSPYPDTTDEQKEAKDNYANANQQVLQNEYRSDFTVAGGKTQKAKTSNDYPQGTKGPVSGTNKLPTINSFAR